MHDTVIAFAHRIFTADVVAGRTILEVGACIVNGSVRPHILQFQPAKYVGVDIVDGPGVDEVVDCTQLTKHFGHTWDIVVSTEMLEHAQNWRACVAEMAASVAPGGMLFVTTRSPGMGYHNPPDYWRYTMDDMALIVEVLDLEPVLLEEDPFPGHPGVFLVARKRRGTWNPRPERLASIMLTAPDTSKRTKRPFVIDQWAARESESVAVSAGRGYEPIIAEERGQKLVVAFPLYRQVPVSWLFQWLQMEKRHVAATVGTEGVYLPSAMAQLVNTAFDECPDFDRIVFYEHDMIPPLDAFERIANYRTEHDIVGAIYFKHDWPHHVMAWMQVQPPFFSPLTAETTKTMVNNPALYEVDAVAMGFTAISRRVFEEWDRSVPMWDPIPPLIGHDLHFCNEAKKQGFKIWLDTGIGCGHLTTYPIGYPHSQQALAVANPPRWTGPAKDGIDTYDERSTLSEGKEPAECQ